MRKGDPTPKKQEVEFAVLQALYLQAGLVFEKVEIGDQPSIYGSGQKPIDYNLLGAEERKLGLRDDAWIEHQVFEDATRHDIYRICRDVLNVIDGVNNYSNTVYSIDTCVYQRYGHAEYVAHLRCYERLQIVGNNGEEVSDVTGYLVSATLEDGRAVILRQPKTVEDGLLTTEDVNEINLILNALNGFGRTPHKPQRAGRAVLGLVKD